jgi:thioredoxin-like negative regulator of GroEL
MIERLLFVALAFAFGFAVYLLVTRRQLSRVEAADPLLQNVPKGLPAIVYFTTPNCAPCLQRLQHELGESLRVIRVDATENPDAATRWGVFSVPTTFVLDGQGKPRSVYNGVVSADVLKRELRTAAESQK